MSLGGEGQTGYKYTKEHSEKTSNSLKKAYSEGRRIPVFGKLSSESVKNIRDGARKWSKENTVGSKNPMHGKGKSVIINNVEYPSIRICADALNLHLKTVTYRINSASDKFKNWTYK